MKKMIALSTTVLVWSQLAFSISPCEKPINLASDSGYTISKTILEAIASDTNTVPGSARLIAECRLVKDPSQIACLSTSQITYENATKVGFDILPPAGSTLIGLKGFTNDGDNIVVNFDGNSVEASSEYWSYNSRFVDVPSGEGGKTVLSYDESSGKLSYEWFTGTKNFLFLKSWKLESKSVYKCTPL